LGSPRRAPGGSVLPGEGPAIDGEGAGVQEGGGTGVERGAGGCDVVHDQDSASGVTIRIGAKGIADVGVARVQAGLSGLLGGATAVHRLVVEWESQAVCEAAAEEGGLIVATTAAAATDHGDGGDEVEVAREAGRADVAHDRIGGGGQTVILDGENRPPRRSVEDEGCAQLPECGGGMTAPANGRFGVRVPRWRNREVGGWGVRPVGRSGSGIGAERGGPAGRVGGREGRTAVVAERRAPASHTAQRGGKKRSVARDRQRRRVRESERTAGRTGFS